eukprot:2410444-Amphidinium_carterae.1
MGLRLRAAFGTWGDAASLMSFARAFQCGLCVVTEKDNDALRMAPECVLPGRHTVIRIKDGHAQPGEA